MDSLPSDDWVRRARDGDESALSRLFERQRTQLLRLVTLRIEPSLRRRLDPADVVQEAWLDVVQRYPSWRAKESLPFHVWARLVTRETLATAHRRHLGTQKRDANRDVMGADRNASMSAIGFADAFVASSTSPTQAAQREEVRSRVTDALESLDDVDREIVTLRHFEGLSNEDAAMELDIDPAAASKRFVRALTRLKPALLSLGGDETKARG